MSIWRRGERFANGSAAIVASVVIENKGVFADTSQPAAEALRFLTVVSRLIYLKV
jgi:hypothetical protein